MPVTGISCSLTGSTPRSRLSNVIAPTKGSVLASPNTTGTISSNPASRIRARPIFERMTWPLPREKEACRVGRMPRASKIGRGTTVKVEPVSTRPCNRSKRSPVESPTSNATVKVLIVNPFRDCRSELRTKAGVCSIGFNGRALAQTFPMSFQADRGIDFLLEDASSYATHTTRRSLAQRERDRVRESRRAPLSSLSLQTLTPSPPPASAAFPWWPPVWPCWTDTPRLAGRPGSAASALCRSAGRAR